MEPTDLRLVLGLVLLLLAIPSAVAAWSDRRWPVVALVVVAMGAVLIGWAWAERGGYAPAEVPDAIFRVIGAALRGD